MLTQIDLRMEDSRQDPVALEEVVPRRRLGGLLERSPPADSPETRYSESMAVEVEKRDRAAISTFSLHQAALE